MKGIIELTQQYYDKINDRIDYLDDGTRKSNLIISGMKEKVGENYEKCPKKKLKLIKDKMEIDDITHSTSIG